MQIWKTGCLGVGLLLIGGLSSCRKEASDGFARAEILKPDPVLQKRKQELVGIWKTKMVNPASTPSWLLTFQEDGRYESFYKPATYKEGTWDLANDTTLYLTVNEMERFTIVQLQDSLLEIRSEGPANYSEVMIREK